MTTAQRPLFDDYFAALVRCDPAAATDLVLELLDAGASLREVVRDVLAPAQTLVGRLWETGAWSVAQEHAATAVTEAAVSALWVMTARRRLEGGPSVAVACAEGEWHALPPRMAAALAAEAGADVTVLGPSMPADHLEHRLGLGDVDVLALSCTVPTNLLGAARCVAAAHAVGLPVVVGGRAFAGRPQRAAGIGADLLADAPERLAEPPPAAGDDIVVPAEVLWLDDAHDSTDEDLLHGRRREDVRWLLRSTGAAVLTDDETLLDDALATLLRAEHGRGPDRDVLDAVDVVAAGIVRRAPRGAAMLHDAVARAREAATQAPE